MVHSPNGLNGVGVGFVGAAKPPPQTPFPPFQTDLLHKPPALRPRPQAYRMHQISSCGSLRYSAPSAVTSTSSSQPR